MVQRELVDVKQLMKERNWLCGLWQEEEKSKNEQQRNNVGIKKQGFHFVYFARIDYVSVRQERKHVTLLAKKCPWLFKNVIWTGIVFSTGA